MLKKSKTCSTNALSCDLVYIYCPLGGSSVLSTSRTCFVSDGESLSDNSFNNPHRGVTTLYISSECLKLDSVDDRRGVEPEKDYDHVSTRLWVGTFDLAAVRRLAVANAL